MKQQRKSVDKPLMLISLTTIFFIVAGLSLYPEQGNAVAKMLCKKLLTSTSVMLKQN